MNLMAILLSLTIVQKHCFRPQQGLTIMNRRHIPYVRVGLGFRPQQGLTIMNNVSEDQKNFLIKGFRPQQGLTIMNNKMNLPKPLVDAVSFRPQQGLTIMNPYLQNPDKH